MNEFQLKQIPVEIHSKEMVRFVHTIATWDPVKLEWKLPNGFLDIIQLEIKNPTFIEDVKTLCKGWGLKFNYLRIEDTGKESLTLVVKGLRRKEKESPGKSFKILFAFPVIQGARLTKAHLYSRIFGDREEAINFALAMKTAGACLGWRLLWHPKDRPDLEGWLYDEEADLYSDTVVPFMLF